MYGAVRGIVRAELKKQVIALENRTGVAFNASTAYEVSVPEEFGAILVKTSVVTNDGGNPTAINYFSNLTTFIEPDRTESKACECYDNGYQYMCGDHDVWFSTDKKTLHISIKHNNHMFKPTAIIGGVVTIWD